MEERSDIKESDLVKKSEPVKRGMDVPMKAKRNNTTPILYGRLAETAKKYNGNQIEHRT